MSKRLKHSTENYPAEYHLVRGLMLAFNDGLINMELVKVVLKNVRRSKDNKKLIGKINERRPEKLQKL